MITSTLEQERNRLLALIKSGKLFDTHKEFPPFDNLQVLLITLYNMGYNEAARRDKSIPMIPIIVEEKSLYPPEGELKCDA